MVTKSPENNTTAEIKTTSSEIISTKGTEISKSPKGKKIVIETGKDTENLKQGKSDFEALQENSEYNEILKEVMSFISFTVEGKLGKIFTKEEKENIKLALTNDFSNKINNLGDFNITDKIKDKLKSFVKSFTEEKNKDDKDKKINDLFSELGIKGLKKDIDTKLGKIIKERKEKNINKFDKLGDTFTSLGLEKSNLDKIKENLGKTSKKFDNFSKTGETIKKTADKLGMGKMLNDLLDYIKKEFPFLGSIIAMFMKGFDKKGNNSEKNKKSTDNLKTFLEKDKKNSPLDKIEERKDLKEKLNPENLKSFYKYLGGKKIDYTKDTFWKEFLTGKSNNKEIKKINLLLKNSLKQGESLEKIKLEDFIKKLNNISKLTKNDELKIEEKSPETSKERKAEIVKEIKENNSFSELLKTGFVMVNGKKEKISIENEKIIKIGENKYSISIIGNGLKGIIGNVFENISLNNGSVIIKANGETVIYSIEKVIPLLKDLLKDGGIKNNIDGKDATLTIKKV